jgi:peptidoglycan/LPS O-acetylase OafA/YrhL
VRQRESALAESMEQRQKGEQFRVLEPALPAVSPAAPRRPRLFALALLAAIAASVAAVFGPEALDSSVHTVEQLQARCDLPVLVSIPQIVGPDDRTSRRRRFGLAAAGLSLAVVVLVTGGYFLARENAALSGLLIR